MNFYKEGDYNKVIKTIYQISLGFSLGNFFFFYPLSLLDKPFKKKPALILRSEVPKLPGQTSFPSKGIG
jgi:hypothetical protein